MQKWVNGNTEQRSTHHTVRVCPNVVSSWVRAQCAMSFECEHRNLHNHFGKFCKHFVAHFNSLSARAVIESGRFIFPLQWMRCDDALGIAQLIELDRFVIVANVVSSVRNPVCKFIFRHPVRRWQLTMMRAKSKHLSLLSIQRNKAVGHLPSHWSLAIIAFSQFFAEPKINIIFNFAPDGQSLQRNR